MFDIFHNIHLLYLQYGVLVFSGYGVLIMFPLWSLKSSGTSDSDLSLLEYESFHFDLSIDQLPPVDRSDFYHKEFADELAHIISPPEYDHFYFDLEDDPGEFTILLKKNISDTTTKDLTNNKLNDLI
nr:hypothetical protein [Tanacetum cinerariifolium]